MKRINQAAKYGSPLLPPNEAAEYLDTTVRTLAKWRCIGTPNIPYVKIGRSVKYRLSDLENYLAKHTVNGEVA
jgi:excisionase family DNA binding protein